MYSKKVATFNPYMGLCVKRLVGGCTGWILIGNSVTGTSPSTTTTLIAKYAVQAKTSSGTVIPSIFYLKALASFDGCPIIESRTESGTVVVQIINQKRTLEINYTVPNDQTINTYIEDTYIKLGKPLPDIATKMSGSTNSVQTSMKFLTEGEGTTTLSLGNIQFCSPKYVANCTHVPPPPPKPLTSDAAATAINGPIPYPELVALTKVCDAMVNIASLNSSAELEKRQYLPYLTTAGLITPAVISAVQASITSFLSGGNEYPSVSIFPVIATASTSTGSGGSGGSGTGN